MVVLKKLSSAVNKVCGLLAGVFLFEIFACTLLQIIFRYFLVHPLSWADEASRYGLVYLTFVGSAVGVYEGSLAKVDMLVNAFSQKVHFLVEKAVDFVSILIFTCLFCLSVRLLGDHSTISQISPSMGFSMAYVYFSLVLGLGLCLVQNILRLILSFQKGGVAA